MNRRCSTSIICTGWPTWRGPPKSRSARLDGGAVVGRERPALAAALLRQPHLLAAPLLLLADLAAALFVGFFLAGRHRVDAGRDRFHRQGRDGHGRARDRADDAA